MSTKWKEMTSNKSLENQESTNNILFKDQSNEKIKLLMLIANYIHSLNSSCKFFHFYVVYGYLFLRKLNLTNFSLMLAPFCNRISTTSPSPLPAALCNGVWNTIHIKYISEPFLVNSNLPTDIKDMDILFLSSNQCSSHHSQIEWSILSGSTNQSKEEKRGVDEERR